MTALHLAVLFRQTLPGLLTILASFLDRANFLTKVCFFYVI